MEMVERNYPDCIFKKKKTSKSLRSLGVAWIDLLQPWDSKKNIMIVRDCWLG